MKKFKIGDYVAKTSGSQWSGRIVGEYSTNLTPEGYAVESSTEHGSVQIYPAKALELADEPAQREPVAWMDREGDIYKMPEIQGWAPPHTLLYTTPPQRKPLTNEEIKWMRPICADFASFRAGVRQAEREHGIGSEE